MKFTVKITPPSLASIWDEYVWLWEVYPYDEYPVRHLNFGIATDSKDAESKALKAAAKMKLAIKATEGLPTEPRQFEVDV